MYTGSAVVRYWNTIRHLRPSQIVQRLRFQLVHPIPNLAPAPNLRVFDGRWVEAAERRQSLTGPFRFRFLNIEHEPANWEDSSISKLWLYNLHYFDDLNAVGSRGRRNWHKALIERWIADNPPTSSVGWEPYPLSLRIVNWIKFALSSGELPPDAIDSLAIQARWLTQCIEWHLLGNHLFTNGKALVFAGSFFDGPEAQDWLALGEAILEREIKEQICNDGGHFERSPMYHALALEDALDLLNLQRATSSIKVGTQMPIQTMLKWLETMTHPDGEISLFNDAAINISPSPAALNGYANRLDCFIAGHDFPKSLPDSGYERLEVQNAVVLADVAPLGPDYLPAHGHADTLCFEMSLNRRRLIVNSGTSVYGLGAERLRQRGTSAHNTLVIDGVDSSEVWGGFRVARRARVLNVQRSTLLEGVELEAAHNGYHRLPGSPIHRRRWLLEPGRLTITDVIDGKFQSAETMLHFHPNFMLEQQGNYIIAHSIMDDQMVIISITGGEGHIRGSSYHPEFGLNIPNQKIVTRLTGNTLTMMLNWPQ